MPRPHREQRLEFNRRLKALRTSRGLTQVEMAEKLGIERDAYAKYESRSMMPPIYIGPAAEIFGVPAKDLLPIPESQAQELLAAALSVQPELPEEEADNLYRQVKHYAEMTDNFITIISSRNPGTEGIKYVDRCIIVFMFLVLRYIAKEKKKDDIFSIIAAVDKAYDWYRTERKSGRDPSLDSIENFLRYAL
jgi:transcriptional regulator with XRE-family HTH domain